MEGPAQYEEALMCISIAENVSAEWSSIEINVVEGPQSYGEALMCSLYGTHYRDRILSTNAIPTTWLTGPTAMFTDNNFRYQYPRTVSDFLQPEFTD